MEKAEIIARLDRLHDEALERLHVIEIVVAALMNRKEGPILEAALTKAKELVETRYDHD